MENSARFISHPIAHCRTASKLYFEWTKFKKGSDQYESACLRYKWHLAECATCQKGLKSLSERLPEEVFMRIHIDIGQASTCWSNLKDAGDYETERASKIAFELCKYIAEKLEDGTLHG